MDNANYIRHFKVLGKLCKLYDLASTQSSAQNSLLAAFVDQYADGTDASLPAVLLFPSYTSAWASAISGGPNAMKSLSLSAATQYLVGANFTDDLTTAPAGTSVSAVLAALQTEMGAGEDDKTLATKASSGLVNFFDTILGSSGTWNTETDASADYKDSVYVVSAVV